MILIMTVTMVNRPRADASIASRGDLIESMQIKHNCKQHRIVAVFIALTHLNIIFVQFFMLAY